MTEPAAIDTWPFPGRRVPDLNDDEYQTAKRWLASQRPRGAPFKFPEKNAMEMSKAEFDQVLNEIKRFRG